MYNFQTLEYWLVFVMMLWGFFALTYGTWDLWVDVLNNPHYDDGYIEEIQPEPVGGYE